VGNGLTVGAGDPDLIITSYRPEILSLGCFGNLSMTHARVLALVRDGFGSEWPSLVAASGMKERELLQVIEGFQSIGALRCKGHRVEMRATWASILPETVAVEAKVSKWRDALRQAARNQVFTHRSFVALPERLAQKVQSDPDFDFFGIGILGVDEKGSVKILKKAIKKVPTLWLYHYYIAIMVAKSQGEVARCPSSYPLLTPNVYSPNTSLYEH
jgi:hypothetical protein